MSYFGSKFPEGISSDDYVEIGGVEDVSCPKFRRVVMKSLSARSTERFTCDGCGTKEAIIIVVDTDTERLFVRRNSACSDIGVRERPKRTPPPSDE